MHLIDINQENILKSYKQVRQELKKYSSDLIKKKEIIVFSKIDLMEKEEILKKVKEFNKFINVKIYLTSSIKKEGLLGLKKLLISNVH